VRRTRYQAIADDLRVALEAGDPPAGGLLPSEAELSTAFGASRVTVRRSLELLRDEGLVDSRQGFGWFVPAGPLQQSLARLGTIEEQLAIGGIDSTRRVLDLRHVRAHGRVAELLGAGRVLRVRRVNLADAVPFALVTVFCPDDLAADIDREAVERATFHELLAVELGGATQTVGAAAASESEAEALGILEGSPVLRCERITRDVGGRPVLVSEHVFPGHLTELVVELPRVDTSMAPSGMRLVE
jgi:GntR family transcriptional regulator